MKLYDAPFGQDPALNTSIKNLTNTLAYFVSIGFKSKKYYKFGYVIDTFFG